MEYKPDPTTLLTNPETTADYATEAFELASEDVPGPSGTNSPTGSETRTLLQKLFTSAFPDGPKTAQTLQRNTEILTSAGLALTNQASSVLFDVSAATVEFSQMASAVTQTSTQISEFVESVRQMISKIPELINYAHKICDAIAIFVDIIIAWTKKMTASIPTLIYRILELFSIPTNLIQISLGKLSCYFLPLETNQAGSDTMLPQGKTDGLVTLLTELTGMFIMKKIPTDQDLKAVNDRLRFTEMFKRQTTGLIDSILHFVRHLPLVCKEWAHRILPLELWLDLFAPGSMYYQWLNEVEMLHTRATEEQITYNLETQERIRQLHKIGQQMIQQCSQTGPEFNKVFSLLRDKFKYLDDLYEQVDASGSTRNARPVPFVIYLYGPPGQGKSFLTSVLPAILSKCPPNTPNISWSRNAGIAHWDGYTGQYAIIYDDFDATRGVNVAPGEHAELMSIVSNEQYRLPMASLEKKGEVFRSKVVIISSNTPFPAPNTINHREALWRRRHAMYEVTVHPEFRKPGSPEVDPARIPQDNSHYRMRRVVNPVRENSNLTDFMTYQEFVHDIKTRHGIHQTEQRQAIDASRRMIQDEVERELLMPEGKLTDMLDSFKAYVENEATFGQKFLDRLRLLFPQVMPAWLKATLTAVGIISGCIAGVAAMRYLLGENKRDVYIFAENMTLKIVNDLNRVDSDEKFWIEGGPGWNTVRTALTAYEGQLSKEELDAIAWKYVPEGAYHGVRNQGPPPRIMRLEGKEQNRQGYRNRKIRETMRMQPEGQRDPNAMSVVQHCVYDNLVTVGRKGSNMHALFLVGRVMLLPRHFFHDIRGLPLQKGEVFNILWYESVFQERYEPKNRMDINGDSVLYLCSPSVVNFKDIRKHFLKDSDLNGKGEFHALLCQFVEGMPYIQQIKIQRNLKEIEVPFDFTQQTSPTERGNIIRLHQGWTYDAQTEPGACGAPVVAMDNSLVRKIVGIHVAATPTKSYAAAMLVTQEMIQSGFEKFPKIVLNPGLLADGVVPEITPDMMQPQGNFSIIGHLTKRIHQSSKTKVTPSTIHGMIFEPTTAPAVLSTKDPRLKVSGSPLLRGVEKYGNIAPLIDEGALDKIRKHIGVIFGNWEIEMKPEIADEDVAINGLFANPNCPAIPMDTSPGYPYNQRNRMPGQRGKEFLFEKIGEQMKIADPELRAAVDARLALAKKGFRCKSLWIDSLKDERRSLEKIALGKTRIFTIPPVDFTIVFRKYTIAFMTSFVANHRKFFSAVGIDPESMDWTDMENYLQQNSDTGFAGDYSGWDGNISPGILRTCAQIINDWYNDTEEDKLVRYVLFDEIAHTPQAFQSTVYMTHIGVPSGVPGTANLNTIIGAIYLYYCWLKLAPPNFQSLSHFEENVRMKIFGDDNKVSVKVGVRSFFNPDNISLELAKLNLTYTSASKNGKAEWLPLENLTFLKRGFRKSGKYWLPLMDEKTIRELTNWTRESDFMSNHEMTISNCNEALRFAFFYGPDYFEKLYRQVNQALKKDHHLIHSLEYYHSWFYENCETSKAVALVDLRGTQRQVTLRIAIETDSTKALDPLQSLDAKESGKSTASRFGITRHFTALDADEMKQKERVCVFSQNAQPDRIMMLPQTDSIRNLANAKGMISLTQRTANTDNGSQDAKATSTKLAAECMADPPWTLAEMSERRVWKDTFSWTTSLVQKSVITKLTGPWDFLVNYLQQAPFERFLFYNGSMKLRIHVNGTRMHQGRLIVAYVPWTRASMTTKWHELNLAALMGVPHVFLDASANNEGVLDIPFYNPKSFLSLNGPTNQDIDYTGTFLMIVLAPLKAATGTSSAINVNVWVEFPTDAQFRIPLHTAQTGRAFNQDHRQQMERRIRMTPQGNTMSSSTTLNNYGNVDNLTVPSEMTGDSIGNGNSASGIPMDKPGYMANPIPVRLKAMQNLASTVGTELVTRLDLDPSQQNLSISEMFSTETDEMEMKWLLNRPTYMTMLNWTTTQDVGTSLGSYFLGPMCSLFQSGSQSQIAIVENTVVPMTQWEYVAKNFRFWRGGLKIRFDIVATQFHVGRLFFALNYGAPPDSETGLRDATSQYGVEIDLQNEKHTFEFHIPYNTAVPWLEVCRGPKSNQEAAADWYANYFLGSWNLRVLNKLVVPDNIAANVDIIVSISGADDFVVYYPSMNNTCFNSQELLQTEEEEKQEKMRMIPQSDTGKNDDMAGEDAPAVPTTVDSQKSDGLTVAPPGASVGFPHSHFGRKAAISHLGAILKRYTFLPGDPVISHGLTYQECGMIGQTGITNYDYGFFNIYAGTTTAPSSWCAFEIRPVGELGHYGSPMWNYGTMFRFWRGAKRFKVFWQNLTDNKGVKLNTTSYGTAFVPGEPNGAAGNANWSLIVNTILCNTDWDLNATTGAVMQVTGIPSIAADVALDVAPYNEVEIPFTTQFNVLATNNYNVSALPTQMTNTGYVVFYTRFTYSGLPADVTTFKTESLNSTLRVLGAAGDDFRFGTFLGVPQVVAGNVYNNLTALGATGAFDTWIITQPTPPPTKEDWEDIDEDNLMTKSMIEEAMHKVKEQRRVRMAPQGILDQDIVQHLEKKVLDHVEQAEITENSSLGPSTQMNTVSEGLEAVEAKEPESESDSDDSDPDEPPFTPEEHEDFMNSWTVAEWKRMCGDEELPRIGSFARKIHRMNMKIKKENEQLRQQNELLKEKKEEVVRMVPQGAVANYMMLGTLFDALQHRAPENARMRLNELKGILHFELEIAYTPMGPDNSKSWMCSITTSASPYEFANGIQGIGDATKKVDACEKAASFVNAELIIETMKALLKHKEKVREEHIQSFKSRIPEGLFPTEESTDCVKAASAQAEVKPAGKEMDVSREEEPSSVLPTDLPHCDHSDSDEESELTKLMRLRDKIMESNYFWEALTARNATGVWRKIKKYGLRYEVSVTELPKTKTLCIRIVLIAYGPTEEEFDPYHCQHVGVGEAYYGGSLDDADQWDDTIEITLLRALDVIIDEKKKGWVPLRFQ